MLRYFYLLLAINCILCYDYISDHNIKRSPERRLLKKSRRVELQHHKARVQNNRYAKKAQDYDMVEDKEPIAQIDVASFIQNPDEYAVDKNFYEVDTKKSDTNLNRYNDYESLSKYDSKEDIVKRSNKRPYYKNPLADNPFDLGPKHYPNKDKINSRHLNLDSLSSHGLNNGKIPRNLVDKPARASYERAFYDADNSIAHNSEKKCAFKSMKFPFFFHNKSDIAKPKKAKKRKLFCFNCPDKKQKDEKSNAQSADSHDTKESGKKEVIESAKMSISDRLERLKPNQKRNKREQWLDDRERQLKELEGIQQKIDNMDIKPLSAKLPEPSHD